MKIRRFVAKDMRSALAQIKEELGVDAVIMSNKKIPEGVELMAAVDYNQVVPEAKKQESSEMVNETITQENREVMNDVVNIASMTGQTDQRVEPNIPADSLSALLNRQVQHENATSSSSQMKENNSGKTPEDTHDDIEEQLRSFTERLRQSAPDGTMPAPETTVVNDISQNNLETENSTEYQSSEAIQMASQLHNQANQQTIQPSTAVSHDDFEKMQQEMASIRQLLEHQISGLMWQDMAQKDPQRAVLVSRLMSLGLSEPMADQIAGYVPAQLHEAQAWQHAMKNISEQINTTQNDIIHRGGVVALVGPTGVGKTTTIAKLAARFSQIHGHDQVALISTDTFRIAGFEQLAIYGKIIGCQVQLAKDAQALDTLLQQFSKKKLVLIDTAGMGQRDMRLAQNLANLVSNSRVRIRNYLVLAANSQQGVMQENVERFKKVPLSGCIFTKLDESLSVGEIITTSIQNGLPIGYLTDGQRVPEDIKVANAEKLVTLADKMAAKKNEHHLMTKPLAHQMPSHSVAIV